MKRLYCLTFPVSIGLIVLVLLSRSLRPVYGASFHDVVIYEIAWAGTSVSSNDEWIELKNVTNVTVDLSQWRLISSDGTPAITLTGQIPPNGYFMLERTNDDSSSVLADQIYTGALINSGEILTLTDVTNTVIDVAGSTNGWLAGDNSSRKTMQRIDIMGDGTSAASWQDGIIDGTPMNSIIDGDNDSYGYSPNIDWRTGAGSGFEAQAEDCDDTLDTTYPNAPELFDVVDNDCDIEIDETFVLGELDYEVYFNSENLYAFNTTTTTNAVEDAALSLIDNANSSIDLAIYGFDRESLKNALIAAHNRGVTVRVAADYAEYHNTRRAYATWEEIQRGGVAVLEAAIGRQGNRSAVFAELEAAGITVFPSNYVSYLQHNKFMVVDSEVVFTGSTNWTDTGFSVNLNNALVLTSSHIAKAYSIEFAEMVEDGRFATAKLNNTPHVFTFTNGTVEVYFSPSDMVEEQLIEVFENTQNSLHFNMFFWTSDALGDIAVSKFVTDGIAIQGVWDAVGARNAFSEDEKMCGIGIPLKIELAGGKGHNKMGVFDADGSNPIVVTGSYNWTASGTESNDENTLIIRGNTALAQAYKADVLSVYNALPIETICGNISPESGLAACSNGRDDDFDNIVDLNDPNCRESTVATCTDGIDNDEDGDVDTEDLDCFLLSEIPTAIHLSTFQIFQRNFLLVLASVFLLIVGTVWIRRYSVE